MLYGFLVLRILADGTPKAPVKRQKNKKGAEYLRPKERTELYRARRTELKPG
jgi:hypothetical protein